MHAHLFCGLFYILFCLQRCLSKRTINLESYDCTHLAPFDISDAELVSVIARPRVDIPTRTNCKIQLQAQPNRWLNIYLQDIDISDCGVKLDFFEGDPYLKSPFRSFGCHSSPGALFTTYSNNVVIRLSKISSAATRYRIQIELSTNKGPKLGTSRTTNTGKQFFTLTTLYVALLSYWLI